MIDVRPLLDHLHKLDHSQLDVLFLEHQRNESEGKNEGSGESKTSSRSFAAGGEEVYNCLGLRLALLVEACIRGISSNIESVLEVRKEISPWSIGYTAGSLNAS